MPTANDRSRNRVPGYDSVKKLDERGLLPHIFNEETTLRPVAGEIPEPGTREVHLNNYRTLTVPGFEEILECRDSDNRLRAVIAVHDTTLGPALGGCRMWRYASEADAMLDAQRLARGMTFKAALAELPLGGGKAVILGDSRHDKSPELFRAFGRAVEHLRGIYITSEDVGTSVADMDSVRLETDHVAGLAGGSGDPSPMTALGVLHGMRAAVRHRYGADDLAGITVAVQGLGQVGLHLCQLLHEAGARLVVSDVVADRVQQAVTRWSATSVAPDAIIGEKVDVFAPCALGGIINRETRKQLRAGVVAGAANNQLESPGDGVSLHSAGVLYAPDYVINAGGLISGSWDILRRNEPFNRTAAAETVAGIGPRLQAIFNESSRNQSPEQVAYAMAQKRLSGQMTV